MSRYSVFIRTGVSVGILVSLLLPAVAIELPKNSKLKLYVEDYLPTDYAPGEDPLSKPELKPKSTELVRLGWQYFNNKEFDTALKRSFMGIRMDSSNASAYFGVAYVCSVQNDLDDAIVFYREALKHEKKYSPIYANLAKALLMKDQQSTEAPSLLDEAIKVDPKNGAAYVTYASYCAVNGKWDAGNSMTEKALALGEKVDPEVLNALKTKRRLQTKSK